MQNSRPPAETGEGDAGSRPWWLAALVIALGGVCLYGAYNLPQGARYAAVGPGMFVTLVGGGLVVLGVILLVQIAQGEVFVAQDTEGASGAQKAHWPAFLAVLLAAALPIFTIRHLGMPITAMLSFTAVTYAFGSRRILFNVVIGALLGAISWVLFTRLGLQLGPFLPFAGF